MSSMAPRSSRSQSNATSQLQLWAFISALFFVAFMVSWWRPMPKMATADEGLIKHRAQAALLGAFVADAASMGLHWVYNQTELAGMLTSRGIMAHPEFMDPPASLYYDYKSGAFSPYGDELYPLVKFLAEYGSMDAEEWTQYLAAYYKAYEGRLNKSSKTMLANAEHGKRPAGDPEDSQANALVKVPAIVVLYAGKPGLQEAVEAAVRAQQDNQIAVDSAVAVARILEKVVLGYSVSEALSWAVSSAGLAGGVSSRVQAQIRLGLSQVREAFDATVVTNGLSCKLPDALINSVVAVSKHGSYVEAIRANMAAGGDGCSRAIVIGALMAAEGGIDIIPEDWRAMTARYSHVSELADELLGWR